MTIVGAKHAGYFHVKMKMIGFELGTSIRNYDPTPTVG
jgi:hypothetical protein